MPCFCNYNDAYMLVKGTITVLNTTITEANPNSRNKKRIIKNCAPFADYINEIKNAQINNDKNIEAVMAMYNLIEYGDNYSKTSGSLCQHCRNELLRLLLILMILIIILFCLILIK